METYGSGNAPDNRKDFLDALKEAIDRGVVVVNVTQCNKGNLPFSAIIFSLSFSLSFNTLFIKLYNNSVSMKGWSKIFRCMELEQPFDKLE